VARPRRINGEPTAYERIREAFWQELAEKDYAKITITSLAKRAGVNHNLLYYYFGNIDEMADRFFAENIAGDFSAQFLIHMLLSGEDVAVFVDESARKRMLRVRLYARGDSAYLTGIFQNAVLTTWLDGSGLSWKDLSFEEQFDLRFVIGGLTTILGMPEFSDSPDKLLGFTEREIGEAARATLNRIRDRKS